MFHECDKECSEYTEKDHPIPNRWVIDGVEYNRCPLSTVDKECLKWLTAYQFFRKGIMPNNGGFLDQSNKYTEIMSFIEGTLNKHMREQDAKRQ